MLFLDAHLADSAVSAGGRGADVLLRAQAAEAGGQRGLRRQRWCWHSCSRAARSVSSPLGPLPTIISARSEDPVCTWLGTDTALKLSHARRRTGTLQGRWGISARSALRHDVLVVTGVGFLIHVYSTGYMAHEGGYYRFFGYLNLFMFSMLTLVLANNLRAAVRRLGRRGPVLLPADRLLLPKESASTRGRRRSSSTASATLDSCWACS